MRAAARTTDAYILLAMLSAAATGRFLDAAALLPGVHETTGVRGGSTAWLVCVLASAFVGVAAAGRWSRTGSVSATAAVVVPGQLAVFVSAEAVVRLANGRGAFDPDAFVGAVLQAGLALVLLAALTMAWLVALCCVPLLAPAPPPECDRARLHPRAFLDTERAVLSVARGPPRLFGT